MTQTIILKSKRFYLKNNSEVNTVLTTEGIRLDIRNQKINPKCVLLEHTVILKQPLCLYRTFTLFYAEATSFLEIPFYIWIFYFLACSRVLKSVVINNLF